jgi:hypothetical protein
MEYTGIPKIIFKTKPNCRHEVGRPKMRWLDDKKADIKTLDIK